MVYKKNNDQEDYRAEEEREGKIEAEDADDNEEEEEVEEKEEKEEEARSLPQASVATETAPKCL